MDYIKIGEVTKIQTGKLDANASSLDGKYPFFTCSKEPLRIDNYSYDCECVLVAGNGDLNVKYYNGKFDAYQRTYIIECNSKEIKSKYLYYFLTKYVETLRKEAIGGVIKYIKLGNLTEAKFPKCDLNRQEEIIKNLSIIEKIVEIRKNQVEKLNDLIKSQFVENAKFNQNRLEVA